MSQAPNFQLRHIGEAREPLLIIDDFARDPEALIAQAAAQSFRKLQPHYPGVQCPLTPAYLEHVRPNIAELLRQHFAFPAGARIDMGAYSLVTTPPDQLTPIQRLPHIDSPNADRIALLHYLCEDAAGGTAFFRHRSTGFETLTEDRLTPYDQALRADVTRHGLPEAAYVSGSTPIFEEVYRVEPRFNRAVLYRGHLLHSGVIKGDVFQFADDPRSGRLTANLFLLPDR